jgi:hypothetical protein
MSEFLASHERLGRRERCSMQLYNAAERRYMRQSGSLGYRITPQREQNLLQVTSATGRPFCSASTLALSATINSNNKTNRPYIFK